MIVSNLVGDNMCNGLKKCINIAYKKCNFLGACLFLIIIGDYYIGLKKKIMTPRCYR